MTPQFISFSVLVYASRAYLQQLSVGDIIYCSVSSHRNPAGVVVRVLSTHPPNVRVFHDLNAKVCKNVKSSNLKSAFHCVSTHCHSLSVLCQTNNNTQLVHALNCVFIFVGFSAWFASKTNCRSCGQYTIAAYQWLSVLWNCRIIWIRRSYGRRHERAILSTKIAQRKCNSRSHFGRTIARHLQVSSIHYQIKRIPLKKNKDHRRCQIQT